MQIGITGGTGFLGRALGQSLLGRGDEVTLFSRRQRQIPGYRVAVWDPVKEPLGAAVLETLDAVVHLAGEPVAGGRWSAERKRRIEESRVLGTRHLVEGWKACPTPPKVLLSGSAVGFYGDRGDEILTEASAVGEGFLAEISKQWEAETEPLSADTRVALLRTGVVLGQGEGALDKMLLPFKLGLGGRLGDGKQWMPWIHVDDWVRQVLFALDNDKLQGPMNLTAPTPVTNQEFTKTMGSVLHRPTVLPVPEFALKLLLGEMANVVMQSQRVLPQASLDKGFVFQHADLTGALEDLIG